MSKAYNKTREQIGELKYLPISLLGGLYNALTYRYQLPHSNETISDMQEAIADHFWDGIEPEWASEEAATWWFGMDTSYFKEVVRKNWNNEYIEYVFIDNPPKLI